MGHGVFESRGQPIGGQVPGAKGKHVDTHTARDEKHGFSPFFGNSLFFPRRKKGCLASERGCVDSVFSTR